jgi:hypothetical protein
VADDLTVVPQPQFPRPPVTGPGGLTPFLLATGHHADLAGIQTGAQTGAQAGGALDPATVAAFEAAAEAALEEAGAAVDEARRNVVALQTALTGATSDLARAQEGYDAVVASIQSM